MSARVRRHAVPSEARPSLKKSGAHARHGGVLPSSESSVGPDCDAFFRAVLDGLEIGVVTATLDEEVSFANHAACALMGWSTFSPCDVASLLGLTSSLERLVAMGGKVAHTVPTADGEALDVELSIHPVERRGAIVGYFVILRDVREDKQRSVERARLERLAAIGTMVAGFAHEVRNPVAALRSLAESLEEELSDANIHLPYVSRMLQVLERVERLVRTSLQFGRPSAPRRARHRPWTIVADALGELSPRTRQLQGDIRLAVDPDLPDVYVDHDQMIQVLVILVNNALDAAGSPKGVLIRVSTSRRPSENASSGVVSQVRNEGVRFSVVDEGPGVPAELLDRIFDPFFTTKAAGTGLGLSIAQHVVSENSGSIAVTSARGGPTTFTVTVPCADATSR